jgi:hypothetical protein
MNQSISRIIFQYHLALVFVSFIIIIERYLSAAIIKEVFRLFWDPYFILTVNPVFYPIVSVLQPIFNVVK